MQVTLRFIYFLSLVLWIGSMFFFSFAAAPSIFKVLPREMAGDLVADIFPKYYLVAYICGALAIVTSLILLLTNVSPSKTLGWIRIAILALMLGLSVVAGGVIRPHASEVKAEMRSLTPGTLEYTHVEARFRKLHRQSVALNAIVFLSGMVIIIVTAFKFKE